MPPCDWALICILVNNISSGYHYYFPHAQKPGVKTVKQVPDIHDGGSELSQTALKLLTLVVFYFFDGEKKPKSHHPGNSELWFQQSFLTFIHPLTVQRLHTDSVCNGGSVGYVSYPTTERSPHFLMIRAGKAHTRKYKLNICHRPTQATGLEHMLAVNMRCGWHSVRIASRPDVSVLKRPGAVMEMDGICRVMSSSWWCSPWFQTERG